MSPHVLGLLGCLLAKHARNISSSILKGFYASGLHDSFCPSLFFGSSPAAGLNAKMPVKTRLNYFRCFGFF